MDIVAMKRFGGVLAALCVLAGWGGVSTTAQAATLTADFNGDGINDTATITAGSGVVSIARGGGGNTSYVVGANWLNIYASETNGVAGSELVATYADGAIWIVDDRANTRRSYAVPPVATGRADYFGEFNGIPGNEIAFIYNDGAVWVIDDRIYGRRSYAVPPATGGRVLYLSELNGIAGTEMAFVYNNGEVWVIDDRIYGRRSYAVPPLGTGRYVQVAEFNGIAGNEIMFSYPTGQSWVIDDRIYGRRSYSYPTNGAAPVYANVDGVAGLEAIFTYGGPWKVWVVDRTNSWSYH